MLLDNLVVKHTSFGEGVIIAQDSKYITVRFAVAEKKFVYPDIFEKFLTFQDGTVPEEILLDINVSKNRKQDVLNKKQEENLRAMTKGIVIPGKVPQPINTEGEHDSSRDVDEF